MKRKQLLYLALPLLAIGCSKEEEERENLPPVIEVQNESIRVSEGDSVSVKASFTDDTTEPENLKVSFTAPQFGVVSTDENGIRYSAGWLSDLKAKQDSFFVRVTDEDELQQKEN